MKLNVIVKLRARTEEVKMVDPVHFEVWVKEPPIEGRANKTVVLLLSEYFGVAQSRVCIISGQTSRNKIVEII